ncbi:MAG: prevent-host-death protein, partial [Lachnospiraceae bacterium]|nr:prevent-host-death protein [Lachnospiraceae bacterium]
MPKIKPISDLRNYTEVLKEVDATSRVYLTRN